MDPVKKPAPDDTPANDLERDAWRNYQVLKARKAAATKTQTPTNAAN